MTGFEHLLRELTPQVLGALVRRYGHFDACEDAVQEALLAASQQWPRDGVPDQPRAWLITVASRRLTDELRSEEARRRRENAVAVEVPLVAPGADSAGPRDADDTLLLLFLCCHPSLNRPAQIALTLRAVGGLTTDEIARALLVPEDTMRKRITRAKQSVRASGIPFRPPPPSELAARLAAVLQVLYLIFNEGYTSTDRVDLAEEAIRLTRLLPINGETAGLLALMLLTHARRSARTTPAGDLIRLDEQDRSLWDADLIAEGTTLITDAMTRFPLGAYQLQAAIAAVHNEAKTPDSTDWPQIVALYDLLIRFDDTPIALLNRAVAVAMLQGPQAGLKLIDDLAKDPRLANHHRVDVARAHLLELAGDLPAALTTYLAAARKSTNLPEQRYLNTRAARLRTYS
ncbi:sigma factor-like helix-turn-helix DNA-binding protein [Kribbella koreensis]|uniref:Sigma factor-like helix-turn-helix DNA-binding protein n=1 Tax=Kribbella koreensis TaxID=57909 RepID=A0ABP4BA69_9ACTN